MKSDDLLIENIISNFKEKFTLWNFFVIWEKGLNNIFPIEKELNLLNFLISKEEIDEEAYNLIKQDPSVINAFTNVLFRND